MKRLVLRAGVVLALMTMQPVFANDSVDELIDNLQVAVRDINRLDQAVAVIERDLRGKDVVNTRIEIRRVAGELHRAEQQKQKIRKVTKFFSSFNF